MCSFMCGNDATYLLNSLSHGVLVILCWGDGPASDAGGVGVDEPRPHSQAP